MKTRMGEEAIQSKQLVTRDELMQIIANLRKDQETLASKVTESYKVDDNTNNN